MNQLYLTVDRIEGRIVFMMDDVETLYRLTVEVYAALCGRSAREGDILKACVENGGVVALAYDEDETVRRKTQARARLNSLFEGQGSD